MSEQNWFGTNEESNEARDIVITFDGGAIPNPGLGYGSFNIREKGQDWFIFKKSKEEYGDNLTNNQAEYMALISACKNAKKMLGTNLNLKIIGDSMLVLKQATSEWKVKKEKLKDLNKELKRLLISFNSFNVEHRPRENSVREFGH